MSKRKPYVEILSDGWQKHLTPREKNAPTVISTFAGMGGSSLGYSMAGFDERLAVEWDDHAVTQFERNFPEVDVYHGDIAKLAVEEALERSGLSPGELDVFDGSPPCQGFSIAGKFDPGDERNQLFLEYVRLLNDLQPKVFVMENVPSMTASKMLPIFRQIINQLRLCGYNVQARIIEAKYYYVPQMRRRVIIMGVRNDLDLQPTFPKRQNTTINVIEALRGLKVLTKDKLFLDMSKKLAKAWTMIPPGKGVNEVYWGGGSTAASTRKVNPLKPCNTITKQTGGKNAFAALLHWDEPRVLTIVEAKRLMSIPDEYILEGSYKDCWARIGNGVPPFMMKAIADTIRKEILDKVH